MDAKHEDEPHDCVSLWEAIRGRPGMYLGNPGSNDPPLRAVICLAASAILLRGATRVHIALHEDGLIRVEDDGRALQVTDFDEPHFPGIAHYRAAVDLMIVSTACEYLVVESGPLRVTGQDGRLSFASGTAPDTRNHLQLRLDRSLLRGVIRPHAYEVFGWARDFAALNAGITIRVSDPQAGQRHYRFPGGLADLIRELDWTHTRRTKAPLSFGWESEQRRVALALGFHHTGPQHLLSYANYEPTVSGGDHLEGAQDALREILGKRAKHTTYTLAVSTVEETPRWAGSVRERIISDELRAFVCTRLLAEREAVLAAAHG